MDWHVWNDIVDDDSVFLLEWIRERWTRDTGRKWKPKRKWQKNQAHNAANIKTIWDNWIDKYKDTGIIRSFLFYSFKLDITVFCWYFLFVLLRWWQVDELIHIADKVEKKREMESN